MMRTFVIAEAAGCHDGDLGQALRLVALAADIGADACKFQWVSSPERLAARRHAPESLGAYHVLAFPREWFPALKTACDERGIEFLCTVFLPEDVAVIAPSVTRFKVSSFEAADTDFINAHAQYGKELILSLGMAGRTRVNWDDLADFDSGLRVLHCVSAYPTPLAQMNLKCLRDPAHFYDGLSDHSRHSWTGALAVSAGAQMIEFHLRLDDTLLTNADYAVARTPAEAKEYVANLRLAETMLGDGRERVMPREKPMLRYCVTTP